MVLAIAATDEHGNAAAAAGPEAVTAMLRLQTDNAGGAADSVPLEVKARPHGGFEVSAVLTAACDFEVS